MSDPIDETAEVVREEDYKPRSKRFSIPSDEEIIAKQSEDMRLMREFVARQRKARAEALQAKQEAAQRGQHDREELEGQTREG